MYVLFQIELFQLLTPQFPISRSFLQYPRHIAIEQQEEYSVSDNPAHSSSSLSESF